SGFRIRILSLFKVLGSIIDVTGAEYFDEPTANIIIRSLLENYLIYYLLYHQTSGDRDLQNLYFNLFDLSSALQFKKFNNSIKSNSNTSNIEKDIVSIIGNIEKNPRFNNAEKKIIRSVEKIKNGQQDFISFVNFTKLIENSPLPTNYFKDHYSYSS